MKNNIMQTLLEKETIWQIYLSNPVFPGRVKLSTVEANTLEEAKTTITIYVSRLVYI